jgi:hypothetical protein
MNDCAAQLLEQEIRILEGSLEMRVAEFRNRLTEELNQKQQLLEKLRPAPPPTRPVLYDASGRLITR